MKKTYRELKEETRQAAIELQNTAADKNYSYYDYYIAGIRFETLGRRYGLLKEFKENGII